MWDFTSRLVLMRHFQYLFLELQVIATLVSWTCPRSCLLGYAASRHPISATDPFTDPRIAWLNTSNKALAIRHFQGALDSPLDQQTANALLLTAMFLDILSFSVVEDENIYNS
ncbi:C6 transcription factor [Metarhizium rileyi]|uniref:C6 transcription factor n=1 Tax=Metarhizium rileyi (strain RCEF 4871) TaxID=1649241 RepID=A0A167CCQ5_METRR|nr:C6 transcription factor [Metarhizium rileyi RCEF 4871]